METIVKINAKQMKEDIKKMVEEQKMYKIQRKSDINIPWPRKISQSEAQWKHKANREKLRLIYAAYGVARGKSFSQIENKYPEENHPLKKFQEQIDKIVKKYSYLAEIEEKGV